MCEVCLGGWHGETGHYSVILYSKTAIMQFNCLWLSSGARYPLSFLSSPLHLKHEITRNQNLLIFFSM